MLKLIIRFCVYFCALMALSLIFLGIEGGVSAFLLLAAVLALANVIIRPIVTALALPFNLLTLGIAGVFINMLTLLIADAIVAGASIGGFWLMLLVSAVIMAADALIRWLRFGLRAGRAG